MNIKCQSFDIIQVGMLCYFQRLSIRNRFFAHLIFSLCSLHNMQWLACEMSNLYQHEGSINLGLHCLAMNNNNKRVLSCSRKCKKFTDLFCARLAEYCNRNRSAPTTGQIVLWSMDGQIMKSIQTLVQPIEKVRV